MVFGSITKRLAGLAVPYITLDAAIDRHKKRKPLPTLFDFDAMRRDHEAGKISQECRNWLEMMILTEAGTPVYTAMLTGLEDAKRPEFSSFKRFVEEVWDEEEAEHGECALRVGKAIGFDLDVDSVRDKNEWARRYFEACDPCKRVLGTTAYTVVQEEMTYQAHFAYAQCSGSPELARMGKTIAAEERYHSVFYASRLRDFIAVVVKDGMPEQEAFDVVADVVRKFEMPTKFHTVAYAKHVTEEKGDQAKEYFTKQKGAIKRQLGPLLMAAGGWPLIRTLLDAGSPLGKFEDKEAEEFKAAAAMAGAK